MSGNTLKQELQTSDYPTLSRLIFEKELEDIKGRVRFLNQQSYDDETDARIAQNEIWDLEPIAKYLEKRIEDLLA
jgi:hypothetical protein